MFGGSAPFAYKTPFNGDPRDWLLFSSRFQALVHDVIPNDAQRLAILTESVGPNVLRRISPLLRAPRGYPAVLSYLKKHYGSSEQIARCQIRDLLSLLIVKPGDRQALELFSDQLHGAVVVLEQGGLEHDLKSAANLDQVVQKLPPLFRHRWARYVRKRLPRVVDLGDLDRFLEEVVEEERIAFASVELTPRIELRGKHVTFDNPNLTRQPSFKSSAAKSPPVRPPPTVLSTQAMREADIECPSCVRLRTGDRTLDVFGLLDTGSQATLLREDAAQALGLTGRPRKIRFGTFYGKDPLVDTHLVDFTVSSLDGEDPNVGRRRMKNSPTSLEYLRGLHFPVRDATEVQVLIGMDVQDAHLNFEVRRPPAGVQGPNAVRTPFGWCIVGRTFSAPAVEAASVNFVKLESIEWLEESVERFWRTRSLPVREALKTFMSELDLRYEVGLPVYPNCPKLPDNKDFARRKFFALERRLQSNDDLRKAVSEQMQEVFRNGHATEVISTDPDSKIWYLPLHPVQHPSKPNKVRLVDDTAARFKGMAINDILLKVLVRECDRPMFRFLWREPGTENPIQEFQRTVHIFVALSSPTTCSFALQRLEKDAPLHLQEVASRIRSDFYVDNLLSSFDEVDYGASVCQKLVELLSLGGFKLVQFLRSSRRLLDRLPAPSRLMPELNLDFDDLPTERTLGYLWNSEREKAQSKRSILAAIASIYDTLGLLATVVLVAKAILQDVWRLKTGWVEVLPADILNRWGRFVEHLPTVESVNIPRSLITRLQSAYSSFQLHAFSDESKDGFGVVVYLRSESPDQIEVAGPSGELFVEGNDAAHLFRVFLGGCDDRSSLDPRQSSPLQRLRCKISEILDSTTPQQWRHVPGILNPADECSRGLCPSDLDPNHRWYRGPEFLAMPPEHWPAQMPDNAFYDDDEESIACLVVIDSSGTLDYFSARIENLHHLVRIVAWIWRFITNTRVLVNRRRIEREVNPDGSRADPPSEPIEDLKTGRQQSADELKSARLLLIRVSQRASFSDYLHRLQKRETIRPESRLLKLSVYLDSAGIIRVGGRLENAPINTEARHPAVLRPEASGN
ncbi:uncharacterized protein LOC130704363 [Daphnia carinata]|uniref:uncharacterized protein LOC130704363 n=1 Tax=Daphnia carinata TaxID=120202 RepID=UPI002868B79F|nr:uncharacterized protein LOC130704363 [Daphnia carinata]